MGCADISLHESQSQEQNQSGNGLPVNSLSRNIYQYFNNFSVVTKAKQRLTTRLATFFWTISHVQILLSNSGSYWDLIRVHNYKQFRQVVIACWSMAAIFLEMTYRQFIPSNLK